MTTESNLDATPLMRQYLKIKAANPGSILLYRMGDFYETFDEDAKITSKVLGITLTSRANGKASKVALAGFPWHSLDTYLHKFIKSGYKVAICEQVEDPATAKGIVKREVVEIVTPGSTVSDKLLEEGKNNYIVAVSVEGEEAGLAWADVSTGAFFTAQIDILTLDEKLRSLEPAEILIREAFEDDNDAASFENRGVMVTTIDSWVYSYDYAYEILTGHFKTKNLKGYGIEDMRLGVQSAGALLHYLQENHKDNLRQFTGISVHKEDSYMGLDQTTVRNLELFEPMMSGVQRSTLIDVLSRAKTAMGSRLLRRWLRNPLNQISEIEKRQDVIESFFVETRQRDAVRDLLTNMNDVERLLGRLSSGRSIPRDLVALRYSLELLPQIESVLRDMKRDEVGSLASSLTDMTKLTDLIEVSLVDEPPASKSDGGYIRDGYNSELDELRAISSSGKDWIASMQAKERKRLSIPTLKIGYNKVFGYYLEVTKPHVHKVPEDFIRKQTLVNSERYITPELKEYEEKVLGAEEKIKTLELKLFDDVREKTLESASEVQWNADVIARIDVLATLALIADNEKWVRPRVEDSYTIIIKNGRHPVVESMLPPGESFVPNDLEIGNEERQIIIVTGPNMAGKSTYLRQIAVIVLLAQMGSFVPASEATIGVVDKLFTRVGASDNLAGGESTFLVEMNETANILNNASDKSLILLDEIGRGTSTYDGLSIAWAVTEYIHNNPSVAAKTLFATHYHELAELEELLPRVFNLNVAVKEYVDKIVFLRKIVPGSADHSYGIQVAQLAGLPSAVIDRAKEVLYALETQYTTLQRRRVKKEGISAYQIGIFDEKETRFKAELKKVDVNNMTPLEAMAKLDELKKKWGL